MDEYTSTSEPQRIPCHSDFTINYRASFRGTALPLERLPFVLRIQSWGAKTYVASHNPETNEWINCGPGATADYIRMFMHDHGLLAGELHAELHVRVPDPDYPGGRKLCYKSLLGVELVDECCGGCVCDVNVEAVLPYAVFTAYDVAAAAGYTGTREDYYAGLGMLPALSVATSDFAAGKAEVADALRLHGVETADSDPLADMAAKIRALRLAADSEPGVISHGGCGVPDLLNLLHNNRRLDDYPYSWAVRTADNHVMLSGADAYLCSDGYFTTEPGEHTFANADEVPESWVIFYHSSPNYTVTASAGILSEICVYNGAPDYNVTATPDSYLRGPLRSYSPDRRVGDGSVAMNINAPRATEIYLPQVTHLVNPGFTGENNTTALSLPDLEEIQTSVYIFYSAFLRIHMPSLRRIVTNTYGSFGPAIKSLILPSLETFSGGTLISNSSVLVYVSLPKLREVTPGLLIRQCDGLVTLELPALETLNGTICSTSMASLTSLRVPVLKALTGGIAVHSCTALTELTLPALEVANAQIANACPALTKLNLPNLRISSGWLVQGCHALTEVNLPALDAVTSRALFYTCNGLVSLTWPSLKIAAASDAIVNNCAALTDLTLPALETMNNGILAYNCAALTELNLPALEAVSGGSIANNCAALTELNLPAVRTVNSRDLYLFVSSTGGKEYTLYMPELETIDVGNSSRLLSQAQGGDTLHVHAPKCRNFRSALFWSGRNATAHVHLGRAIESISIYAPYSTDVTIFLYIAEGARTSLYRELFLFDADNLKQFIADLGDNNNYNTKSLQIGAAALALLSEDDIALAVAKNYTLS